MGKDYYKVLGLTKTATDADIKKAYRKLAMQWHPDKHDDKTRKKAEEMFKDIAEAYDVLSDAEKRKTYDQFGEEGVKHGGGAPGASHGFDSNQAEFIFRNFFGGSGGFGGFDDDDGGFPFRMGGMGMGGMGMGGMPGMSGMGGRTKQKQGPPPPQKAEIATMPLTVTLEELYAGKVRKLKVTRTRWKSKTESYREEKLVEINVKPGWKDGTKITFNGEGDQDAFNALPGDLCFVIQTKEHSRFKRVDGDLHMTVQLPLLKALTGCKVPITTLDGRQIIVDLDSEVIQPDSTKRVSNEGMPGKNGKGDLILNFKVVFPRHLTQEQKEGIAKILPNA